MVIVSDWTTACLSPILEFPSRKAITRVQTSPNRPIRISPNSNGHISVLRVATVTFLGTLLVLHVYVDVTLTLSKVKVEVTGLLNFRKLAKPCMLAAMTVSPLAGLSG